MGLLEAIILSVIAASTPLLLAAAGELVVERSGVLNLGVEGMMIMGAACGFAGAYLTGSTFIGALFGMAAGAALSSGVRAAHARPRRQPGGDGAGAHHSRHRPVGPDRRRLRRAEDHAGAASVHPAAHRSAVRRPNPVRRGRLRLCLGRAGDRHLAGSFIARAPAWCCARSATTTPRRMRSAIRC